MLQRKIWQVIVSIGIVLGIVHPAGSITIQEEIDMSREFMAVITKHYEFIEDPILLDFLDEMGQRILAQVPPPAVSIPLPRDQK